jgi:hypothetical protein
MAVPVAHDDDEEDDADDDDDDNSEWRRWRAIIDQRQ